MCEVAYNKDQLHYFIQVSIFCPFWRGGGGSRNSSPANLRLLLVAVKSQPVRGGNLSFTVKSPFSAQLHLTTPVACTISETLTLQALKGLCHGF